MSEHAVAVQATQVDGLVPQIVDCLNIADGAAAGAHDDIRSQVAADPAQPRGTDRAGIHRSGPNALGQGASGQGQGGKPRDEGARRFEARPAKVDKPVDPDNPFAVLMGLKIK